MTEVLPPGFSRFDPVKYLTSEEEIGFYLEAAMEDGDPKEIADAMAIAERARQRLRE